MTSGREGRAEGGGEEKRVLVLGCSASKREAHGPLMARDLYDGPAFRVFRRYEAALGGSVRLYVFSGKHGLIVGDRVVEPYDARLDPDDAAFGQMVAGQVNGLLGNLEGTVLAVMGEDYLAELQSGWDSSGTCARIIPVAGPPGVRLATLKRWLYAGSAEAAPPCASRREGVTFRGRTVNFDADEAKGAVERALASGGTTGIVPSAWWVDVGGRRVPPKWLVARLTGTRASEFHTHEAVRLLRQLGFEVGV